MFAHKLTYKQVLDLKVGNKVHALSGVTCQSEVEKVSQDVKYDNDLISIFSAHPFRFLPDGQKSLNPLAFPLNILEEIQRWV